MYFDSLDFENEVLNEGLFNKKNKNIKKNCLPIDVKTVYENGRIMCANTHYLTGFRQALESSGVRYGALATALGFLFFGGLGAVPGLVYFLKSFYGSTIYPLIRQHTARDFMVFPIVSENDTKAEEKILNIYKLFNNHPILAINDGKVIKIYNDIENDKHYGTAEGNHIIIEHYNGEFFSLYAHLYKDSIIVSEGDIVCKGQKIAEAGNTGNSEVPHLHFEITYNHPDKYFSLGKNPIDFESYKYAHINIAKELVSIIKNGDQTFSNIMNKKLETNTSGVLDNLCFLS